MKKLRLLLVLASLVAFVAAPAQVSAERGTWNNWHVHDGTVSPVTDETGLTHRGPAFFPLIFGAGWSDPSLLAYCTDATDKALVGGDGGAKHAAGTCRNELYIIHLLWVDSDAQGPAGPGWSTLSLDGGATTLYYLLTPR